MADVMCLGYVLRSCCCSWQPEHSLSKGNWLCRQRLSNDSFSQFLQAIKELNSGKKTREDTLHTALEIFGSDNGDLYSKLLPDCIMLLLRVHISRHESQTWSGLRSLLAVMNGWVGLWTLQKHSKCMFWLWKSLKHSSLAGIPWGWQLDADYYCISSAVLAYNLPMCMYWFVVCWCCTLNSMMLTLHLFSNLQVLLRACSAGICPPCDQGHVILGKDRVRAFLFLLGLYHINDPFKTTSAL